MKMREEELEQEELEMELLAPYLTDQTTLEEARRAAAQARIADPAELDRYKKLVIRGLEPPFYGGMFGLCPHCFDGDVVVGGHNVAWGFCKQHRLCWSIGSGLFRIHSAEEREMYRRMIVELDFDNFADVTRIVFDGSAKPWDRHNQ
jgi:hypothetical protein